jgi:hypothetical protein
MIVNQRDIIEVPFLNAGPHPALVVSTADILIAEGFFYAVLMSTKNIFPEYTFQYRSTMVNSPRNMRDGFILCHQLHLFYEDEIISRSGATLKMENFRQVIEKVNQVIFDLK